MDLQSRHILTSTLISEVLCFSECAILSKPDIWQEIPPETLRPTLVEQFVKGWPQTTLPHNRQWCFLFEKLNCCLSVRYDLRRGEGTGRMDIVWRTRRLPMSLLFVLVIVVGFGLLWGIWRNHLIQALVSVDWPSVQVTTINTDRNARYLSQSLFQTVDFEVCSIHYFLTGLYEWASMISHGA